MLSCTIGLSLLESPTECEIIWYYLVSVRCRGIFARGKEKRLFERVRLAPILSLGL